jgi:two-component system, LytTR family, sensor kinase
MAALAPPAWTTSRGRVALLLTGAAVFAAALSALADELGHAWWAAPLTLPEAFLRLLLPWLIAALLALVVRELVVRRMLVTSRRWLTALLHLLGAVLFPVVHLWLLAVVQHLIIPAERSFIVAGFIAMLPEYYVQGVALYSATAAAFYAIQLAATAGERERQALELKASLSEARLAALRHQLSPHFLFNALNTVSMLIRQGRLDDALSMMAEFGGLMRELLRDTGEHEVSLEQELGFVRRYLEVERIRFADRLEIRVESDPGIETARVPSLILQPLVENAIRHGVARRAAAGRIEVSARPAGSAVELQVRDNGPGLAGNTNPPADSGVGILNVRARLAQLYGESSGLTLENISGGGVAAIVRLPLRMTPGRTAAP